MNKLFYGDNLEVLHDHIADESVDLVYLDPPFNSNRSYNVIFARHGSIKDASAQIEAFDDTWHWTPTTDQQYGRPALGGELPSRVADALTAFRTLLGENDAMAYLVNMAPRLVELRRVLKPTGSLYLHCDPTMSHYLKMMLDAIFGPERFRSEISWRRYGSHNDANADFRAATSTPPCRTGAYFGPGVLPDMSPVPGVLPGAGTDDGSALDDDCHPGVADGCERNAPI